jgi:hypothetical protein
MVCATQKTEVQEEVAALLATIVKALVAQMVYVTRLDRQKPGKHAPTLAIVRA